MLSVGLKKEIMEMFLLVLAFVKTYFTYYELNSVDDTLNLDYPWT